MCEHEVWAERKCVWMWVMRRVDLAFSICWIEKWKIYDYALNWWGWVGLLLWLCEVNELVMDECWFIYKYIYIYTHTCICISNKLLLMKLSVNGYEFLGIYLNCAFRLKAQVKTRACLRPCIWTWVCSSKKF